MPDTDLRERETHYSQDLARGQRPQVRHFPDVATAPDAEWHLHLELADNFELTDERDWLRPGSWRVRLIVGADDGDAHSYLVDVAWKGDEPDADSTVSSANCRGRSSETERAGI